jgi:hypothetical protein
MDVIASAIFYPKTVKRALIMGVEEFFSGP